MLGKLKDERFVASAIAVACMLVDDLPESHYNTFHDPGAAAMLSIIVADTFTLAVRRGAMVLASVLFVPALLLKLFIQPLFWVENAWFWDISTLVVIHALLGFVALRGAALRIRFIASVATVAGVVIALIVVWLARVTGSSWIHFHFELAAARVLIPCAFWTAMLLVETHFVTASSDVGGARDIT